MIRSKKESHQNMMIVSTVHLSRLHGAISFLKKSAAAGFILRFGGLGAFTPNKPHFDYGVKMPSLPLTKQHFFNHIQTPQSMSKRFSTHIEESVADSAIKWYNQQENIYSFLN